MQHFLTLQDIDQQDAAYLLKRCALLKEKLKQGEVHHSLAGKMLALIFDKASTRTRVSFETGMYQLGGNTLFLDAKATQMGRGEPIKDSARVISSMVDIVAVRTHAHQNIQCFADYASVPVINALTELAHPCQILADVFTYVEQRGDIRGKTICWVGDGNNMLHSWINAATLFGYRMQIACPPSYMPDAAVVAAAKASGVELEITTNPLEAATGSDLVSTDVWASMGQEEEQAARAAAFASYQVNENVMQQANKDAVFMHCLPAHRGEEVSEAVLEGVQSVVWYEAENRLHVQKALLEYLMIGEQV